MNQMLEFLYLQVTEKLKDDGISINARNVLTDIKNELIEILKKELTLDDRSSLVSFCRPSFDPLR